MITAIISNRLGFFPVVLSQEWGDPKYCFDKDGEFRGSFIHMMYPPPDSALRFDTEEECKRFIDGKMWLGASKYYAYP
jgi:hypothetical protein